MTKDDDGLMAKMDLRKSWTSCRGVKSEKSWQLTLYEIFVAVVVHVHAFPTVRKLSRVGPRLIREGATEHKVCASWKVRQRLVQQRIRQEHKARSWGKANGRRAGGCTMRGGS